MRPSSASPTEQQLEAEAPTIASLDANPPHDPYAALRLRNYRLYSGSYVLAVIGGGVQFTALAWEIYQKTKSPMSLAWVGGIEVIPVLLLSLPAGQLIDTMSRKRVLIITQWLLAVSGLVLAWLAHYQREWALLIPAMYGLIFLNGITFAFARPARAAILPQLVPPDKFSNAVTWNATTFELSSLAGPALGGFILAKAGAPTAYLFNAICLAACAVFTHQFPPTPVEPRTDDKPGFASLLAGVSFVFQRRILLATMSLDLFAVLLGGAVGLLPIFATDILKVGPIGYGWLKAAQPIGAAAMALILAHRPPMQRAGRALLFAVAGFGAATIIFAVSKNFWLSFAMLALTGAFDNISVVVRHTLVQLLTPNSMRGRVSAVNQVFIGSSNQLGWFESGATAQWWGPVAAAVVGGIGTLVTVATIGLFSPELRKFGRLDHAKPDEENKPRSHEEHEEHKATSDAS